MSFCSDIKNELAQIRPPVCCEPSLVCGLMLFGRSFSLNRICIQTASEKTAELYAQLSRIVYGAEVKVTCGGKTRPAYKAEIISEADRLKILASVDYGVADTPLNASLVARECCKAAFIRGAFLVCGNINDPEKEYRAEFSVKNELLADTMNELLAENGLNFRKTARGNAWVLYTKNSGTIEDLITLIGLPGRTLDIIDTKIMKSVKNNINRARNCDSANISKTVEASIKQRRAIEYLEKADRLQSLPHELLTAAELRRNNPEATLKELCRISKDPLTVSGLNHRLSKIVAVYEELRKKRN